MNKMFGGLCIPRGQEPLEWDLRLFSHFSVSWVGENALPSEGCLPQSHLCYSVSSCLSSLCRLHCHVEPWGWRNWIAQKGICFPLFLLVLLSWVFTAIIRFNTRNFPLVSDNLISLKRCHPVRHYSHCGKPEYQTRAGCPHARLLRGGEYFLPKVQWLINVQKNVLGNVAFLYQH